MMLATWLVEIFLNKWNALEDLLAIGSANTDMDSLTIERQITEEDLKGFMITYQVGDYMSQKTIGLTYHCRTISNRRWYMN